MVFSSIEFLFYFLPLALALYFVVPRRFRNTALLLASLVFYTWGTGGLVALLLCSIVGNFGLGLAAGAARAAGEERRRNRVVGVAVVANLALLGYFKYSNFAVDQVNEALVKMGIDPVSWTRVFLPIGISFFTFHGLSYVVDVARGRCEPLRNPIDFGLYMTLFPQLVAGPIIRYHEISDQLFNRTTRLDDVAEGAVRFAHGLAKKVIIADAVAEVANGAFALPADQRSFAAAWLGVLAYTLQIYFDFSGYSDMAIGLARIFGFRFPENFNRPYSAYSITDFWRRWHITLSNWFRDYLYVPLGGNQGSGGRTYLNLLIVFFATGIWHGANWTFVVWGLYHGALMLIERVRGWRYLDDAPLPALNRAITLFLVAVGWVMFRADSIHTAFSIYGAMFNPFRSVDTDLVALGLNNRNLVVLLAACVVFVLPRNLVFGREIEFGRKLWADPARVGLIAVALPYCALLIASGTFSPFLYFQF
jgi:alginate O-acetyltransferase complex protein AlgI